VAKEDIAAVLDGAARWALMQGDCLDVLRALPDSSVDAVVTDPPYAEIDRSYGRVTEAHWHDLMQRVVRECRRVLTPTGSAVFVLQPNSAHVGQMRLWLWEFMVWAGREWNIIQDVYWWNYTTPPTVHCQRTRGLLRPSLKYCVWLGSPDCYRNQDAVLWAESQGNVADRQGRRAAGLTYSPSGHHLNRNRATAVAVERGGVTPFNVLPMSNTNSQTSAGAAGHGAGTPLQLGRWWARYICPPHGIVLDPFIGSGTTALACIQEGRRCIGIERDEEYCVIAHQRIIAAEAAYQPPLPALAAEE
jgi:site-specific DNA-methyltransferase (adenine-specific)/site-specific DNA-methyltransferase (cytosine-N4-specific)